jgi:hypothetical protein
MIGIYDPAGLKGFRLFYYCPPGPTLWIGGKKVGMTGKLTIKTLSYNKFGRGRQENEMLVFSVMFY